MVNDKNFMNQISFDSAGQPDNRSPLRKPEENQMNDSHNEAIAIEMKRLASQIEQLNDAYYNQDAPLVSDAEYDLLMRRLKDLEAAYPELKSEDSPTVHVGGTAQSQFQSAPHLVPMLSLTDVFSKAEVQKFVDNIKQIYPEAKFIVEQKIDGLSISLEYQNGVLVQALTRGDGIHSGEIVTENIRQIQTVPQVLPEPIEHLLVRGEVYMTKARFTELNQLQEERGEKLFANPRNFAAGTLRQLNPQIVRERGLSVFIFNVQLWRDSKLLTHHESLAYLKQLGFPVIPEFRPCENVDEVLAAIDKINAQRPDLPYGIDGAVVKIDSLSLREELGSTSKVPRWAVAYKYPPEQQQTVVKDLIAQVGRTGRITPMAILEPVVIAQTTVSRATLHNQEYVNLLDIRIGDTVTVHKGGDIIPAIIAVDYSKRQKNTEPFVLPEFCPVCGAKTEYLDDGANLYCTGVDCPAQLTRRIEYFASKDAMDIAGLGESSVQKLWEKGYIRHLRDIYHLKDRRDQLIKEGDIGREKRVDNLLNAIERSTEQPFDRLLVALGIPTIGPATAKNLVKVFQDIDALRRADFAELQTVPDIGPGSARAIINFFGQEETDHLIADLREAGLNLKMEQADPNLHSVFENQTFVLTGTLPNLSRSEAKKLIEKYGGKVSSSVSKKTDYVVAGENAGSKLDKAKDLQISIIDEQQLLKMVE